MYNHVKKREANKKNLKSYKLYIYIYTTITVSTKVIHSKISDYITIYQ